MKNEKIIETLNLFLERTHTPADINRMVIGKAPVSADIYYIIELYKNALKELSEEATKKARGSSFISLSKKVQKELEKQAREHLRLAWFENINGEDMQCFITREASILFCLRDPLDLPQDYEPQINASRLLPRSSTLDEISANYSEIIATCKTMPKSERKKTPVKIGCKHFMPELIIHAFEILGGIDKHEQTAHRFSGDIIHGARGFAFILPCRPATE